MHYMLVGLLHDSAADLLRTTSPQQEHCTGEGGVVIQGSLTRDGIPKPHRT